MSKFTPIKKPLALVLSVIMCFACFVPAFASAEDKTTYVDENGVLHIYGEYSTEYKDASYSSIVVEDTGVLLGDITYDVPVTLVGTVYIAGEAKNNGTIKAGTFNKTVTNNGLIEGGTFNSEVNNKNGLIMGGVFENATIDNASGVLRGGVFNNCEIAVSRIGVYKGTFNGSTITLGAGGSIFGGTYDANCKIVAGSGSLGLDGGTYQCDISGMPQIKNGVFNGAVVNDGLIYGGTYNGTVTNNKEVKCYKTLEWPVFNGSVVNNGTISGAMFGDDSEVTGEGDVYVIVRMTNASGSVIDTTVFDASFKEGANVLESLKNWEKNKSANNWKIRTIAENYAAPVISDIAPDDTFGIHDDNVYVREPIWQIGNKVLEVRSDWNGQNPPAPAASYYDSVEVCPGATLSGGFFTRPVKNLGTITDGTFTNSVVNGSGRTISGGIFTGAVTNMEDAVISAGTFNGDIVNSGAISGADIIATDAPISIKNDGNGSVTGCAFTGDVTVNPDSSAKDKIAVPVKIYNTAADQEPQTVAEANYGKNIIEWLNEQIPENGGFSHKDGVAVDDTEIFDALKTYEFVKGFTYEFEWTGDPESGYTANFFVVQGGVRGDAQPATVIPYVHPATCTDDGYTLYTATINYNGADYTDEYRVAGDPATGHEYDDEHITWNWSETLDSCTAELACAVCGAVRTETADVVFKINTAADCQNEGVYTYTATVNIDGQQFQNAKDETIGKLEHTFDENVAPEWIWADDYSTAKVSLRCAVCGQDIETEAAVEKEEVPATCSAAGQTIYSASVTVLGKEYKDERIVAVPKLPHTYGDPGWTWQGFESAKATFTCSVCSETAVVDATIVKTTKDPSCTENGLNTYTATASINGADYTDVKTEEIPKLPHTYGDPTWVWEGDARAEAYFRCADCGHEQVVVDDSIESKVDKLPTCTEDGQITYTASVTFNGKDYPATREASIPKRHVDTGDNVTYDPGTPSTCTEKGYTAGTWCKDCNKWLTGHTEIELLPHTDEDDDGICDVCGENFDPTKNCDHICHKGGFLGFLWKILRVFYKLFRINPTCKCGAPHY